MTPLPLHTRLALANVPLHLLPPPLQAQVIATTFRPSQVAQVDTTREVDEMTKYANLTEFIDRLNAYDGDDIWEDVICQHPDYDRAATAKAEPYSVCLKSGVTIDYSYNLKSWQFRQRNA
jgi:hypothetical protein